jgi:DNA-binding transcriptional regulator YiaG
MNTSTLGQIVALCVKAEEKRRFASAISDIHRIAAQALLDQREREHETLMKRAMGKQMHEVDAEGLKARREALGLSQPQLGALLGTSVWNVRSWEQGRYAIPAFLHLALYALEHDPPPGYSIT